MRTEKGEEVTLPCEIRMFGAFDIQIDGVTIPPLRSRTIQWLLALLILRQGQALDRVWLAGTLWPESEHSQALYNLRRGLSNLRSALGSTSLRFHASMVHSVSLDLQQTTVDVFAFDTALAIGERDALEKAVALYRGPLLEGCTEEWVFAERRAREESYLCALEKLAGIARSQGEGVSAVNYLRAVIQVDPLREQAQRALIEALAASGEYGAAVQTYRELRLRLRRDLNAEPDPQTLALFERIRSEARRRGESSSPPPLPPHTTPLRRLPSPLTALVGRSSEVDEIVGTLRSVRMLTLTGPGGVGKTRLSIAVAERVTDEYPEGVFFVDLAPLGDPALVVQAIASAVQVQEEQGRSLLTTLQDYLQPKTLLLILDNCEHLLDASARCVDTILRECPGVSVLATSRQSLGLTGEVGWIVPPLSVPGLTTSPPEDSAPQEVWLSQLCRSEAVQLFVIRAQQAQPSFRMSPQNGKTVAQICIHLDGIPLALELAAARVRALPVEEIHRKLDHRFRLLTGGSRTALPRQQTLRALIDWSYDLLTSTEKALLCRLAVFAGGWTLAAAMQVCAAASPDTAEALEEWEILDVLTALADKSLVVYEEQAGRARYRLLETVRQYALERLAESSETETWRMAHRDYFLQLAEGAEKNLSGPEKAHWLQSLENDHDNLRAALDFCLDAPESGTTGLQLSGALQQFWWMNGYLSEGRVRLAAALSCPEAQQSTPARAKALSGAGSLAWLQGDLVPARLFYTEGLTLQREWGDSPSVARILHNLGNVALQLGDYAEARSLFEESVAIKREAGDRQGIANTLVGLTAVAFEQGDYEAAHALGAEGLALGRELDDKRGIARSLVSLGVVAMELGDYVAAGPLFEESLELHRTSGDKRGVSTSLNNLGSLASRQGDYVAAQALYEECLSLGREMEDGGGIAHALCNLAPVLSKQGEYTAAQACLRQCLLICRESGEIWTLAYALANCADLACEQEHRERSVRLFASAHALRAAHGSPLPPPARVEQERQLAALQAALGEKVFQEVWSEGQALTLEQALEYALESLEDDHAGHLPG